MAWILLGLGALLLLAYYLELWLGDIHERLHEIGDHEFTGYPWSHWS